MQVKVVSKQVTPAGNYSALNTEFNLMVKCHLTKPSEVVMMPSTLSSAKPELVNTSQELFSQISNQPSSMKSELVLTDNYSTLNNLFQEKKMPPTTLPEDIIPSEKKSLISAQTESENQLITALVFRDSQCSTQSEVVPDQDLDHSFQKDFQSTTERNPSSVSQFTHHHKSPQPSLNHTTQFFQPTHFLNTLMSLSCQTTKPFTIFAEETQILKDQPTLT